jgi:hypothetical protein
MLIMKGVYPRIIVFLSVVFSPITYLVYGIPEFWPGLPHLTGFIFWFGTIPQVYLFGVRSALWSPNGDCFVILVAMWALTGIYLILNSPPWLSTRVTIGGHAICIALQTLLPFVLFWGYVLVIPFPVPSIVALCILLVYIRKDDSLQKD